MGWYARNMTELQKPNHTIGFLAPTCRLIAHHATSWNQQLYKDKEAQRDTQRLHHPHPTTPLPITVVTDTMKICPFCDKSNDILSQYLYGDNIHLHVHCSNTNLQQTRDASNVDIATALKHLGIPFLYTPYPCSSACTPFQEFLSSLLRQYDDNTRHDTLTNDPDNSHLYRHATMDPRPHRSITSLLLTWNRLRP